jgi:hypothetical protein
VLVDFDATALVERTPVPSASRPLVAALRPTATSSLSNTDGLFAVGVGVGDVHFGRFAFLLDLGFETFAPSLMSRPCFLNSRAAVFALRHRRRQGSPASLRGR